MVPDKLADAVAKSDGLIQRSVGMRTDLTALIVGRTTLRLAWIPEWYACDCSLLGGLWAFYYLRASGSSALRSLLEETGFDGIFYSGVDSARDTFEISGRIDRIIHAKLGELRGLSWGHGMYLVTRTDGSQFVLDDEDGAGCCDIAGINPDDWKLCIEMTVDPDYVRKLHDTRTNAANARLS